MAASFLLLVSATFIFFAPSSSTTAELFKAHYQPYPDIAIPLKHSGTTDLATHPFALYESGDFEAAIPAFEKAIEDQRIPQGTAQFYYGMSLLQLGKAEAAIQQLRIASTADDKFFATPASWYLGLAYLHQNQGRKAREVLEPLAEGSSAYKEKAAAVLKELSL